MPAPRWPQPTREWLFQDQRAAEVTTWPASLPRPWLGNVGAGPDTEIGWFVAGADEFVRRAADGLRGGAPRHEREKHLLALPVIGTGFGGARKRAGDVVRELIPVLQRRAEELDLDLALVTNEPLTFAAAEAQRGTERAAFPGLDDALWAASERLARSAREGELVLFLGAGVSTGSGLPGWGRLIAELARGAGMTDEEVAKLGRLHVLDQARLVEMRLERAALPATAGRPLGQAIAAAIRTSAGYPLAHALLAALPVDEIVTTNYDELFERASRAIGREVSVLPHAPRAGAGRWLLKMHGCVTDPDHIVLTREDYLRYDQRRQALAGIVQALLMMRHMLFVGFSLTDDNFHRIADAVRRARRPASGARGPATMIDRFGTALELFSDPMSQALWADDLDWVTMDGGPPPGDGGKALRQAAARRIDIFLDAVVAQTGTTAHLLNPRHEGALRDDERALVAHVRSFVDAVSRDPAAARSSAWRPIRGAPAEARLERAEVGGQAGHPAGMLGEPHDHREPDPRPDRSLRARDARRRAHRHAQPAPLPRARRLRGRRRRHRPGRVFALQQGGAAAPVGGRRAGAVDGEGARRRHRAGGGVVGTRSSSCTTPRGAPSSAWSSRSPTRRSCTTAPRPSRTRASSRRARATSPGGSSARRAASRARRRGSSPGSRGEAPRGGSVPRVPAAGVPRQLRRDHPGPRSRRVRGGGRGAHPGRLAAAARGRRSGGRGRPAEEPAAFHRGGEVGDRPAACER